MRSLTVAAKIPKSIAAERAVAWSFQRAVGVAGVARVFDSSPKMFRDFWFRIGFTIGYPTNCSIFGFVFFFFRSQLADLSACITAGPSVAQSSKNWSSASAWPFKILSGVLSLSWVKWQI